MVFDRVSNGLAGSAKLSALVLALVNMVPVIGVVLWDWSVFLVVALYWMENVIIGLINIPRMLMANNEGIAESNKSAAKHPVELPKLVSVPLFALHYGIFCVVHGTFVYSLLGNNEQSMFLDPFGGIGAMSRGVIIWAGWGLLFFVLSHLFSFFWNYVGQREYRKTSTAAETFRPYNRVVLLHIVVLYGAFAIELLDSPILLIVILIGTKTAMDLGFHLYQNSPIKDEQIEASELTQAEPA